MSTINLLHIEDNEMVVDIVRKHLQRSKCAKFNIIHKETLRDGLEYLDNSCKDPDSCEIDAILLDLILPNSSGINAFKEIKKKCDSVPVIIISGYEEMAYECMKLGAQDYLIKPELSVDLLERSIRYSIERVKLENEFKNIITTSSLGYHMYKLKDDKLIFCGYNPASNEILGVDNSQFLNKEIIEAFPYLPPEVLKMYRRVIEEGKPWTNQVVEYEDDNINSAYFRLNAYKTAENRLTVTFEDITERIKIQKDLKHSESKYRHLVEVTGAIIFKIDYVSRKFTYVNDVMCEQLGWNKEELLDMGPADVLTESSILVFLERQVSMARGENIDNVFEYEGLRKDGSTFWALVTSEFIQDENKNIVSGNSVGIDITSQKLAEEALKKKEAEVFVTLENKIHEWKEEIVTRNNKKEEQLELINSEILSMSNTGGVL